MTLVPSTAASAVYHDALSTARFWRNLCFLILLLVLAGQLALFFVARYTQDIIPVQGSQAENGQVELPSGVERTESTELETRPAGGVETEEETELEVTRSRVEAQDVADWLYMILYASLWAGLVFSILLSLTLVFTTLVMLNGRTVGVSRVASAFFWSLILLLLLIPWQAILNHPTLAGGPFHLPGVLYTWPELNANAKAFQDAAWLGWLRFVLWPVVALLVLLIVQSKGRRGVKEALGEDLPDVESQADRPAS